ncbi:Exodeoxyribonuclease 7 small subunit [Oligella sp. MSHR50489EDL]|uniref:exodeoxyribonuclease VII small subunit n=1 Tax=Oligella sp. MSHR50489EDL TaxID=3139409 RepID=UPI003D814070
MSEDKSVLQAEQQELPEQFEVAMKELQAIVQSMENQVLSLDDALKAYERGMLLSRVCQQKLEDAQLQVHVLQDNLLRPLAQDDEREGEDE